MRRLNAKLSAKPNAGYIFPTAMIFLLLASGLVGSYFKWSASLRYQLDFRIAKQKAIYNATTGLSERGYPKIVRNDLFESSDSNRVELEGGKIAKMGTYRGVFIDARFDKDDPSLSLRYCEAEGVATVRNSLGERVEVTAKSDMAYSAASLANYMYLTDSERAGGGTFVFDGTSFNSDRRAVTFGAGDILTNGKTQTNEPPGFVMSQYGCPEFHHTVWITYGTTINYADCDHDQVFLGEPDTVGRPPVVLPPKGYQTLKQAATYTFDARRLLKWNGTFSRDTLIMTDIEFMDDGRFRIKQWWYLKPPHLNRNADLGGFEIPMPPNGYYLDGNCSLWTPLLNCADYADSLRFYHSKEPDANGNDLFVLNNETISANHGLLHFDYEPLDPDGNVNYDESHLLKDEIYYRPEPSVIYVRGGQVRVHGRYKGRFTVVTDEYITYRRHAWPQNNQAPRDTLWCNIWLTNDLVNVDSGNQGNMEDIQPDADCEGGTDNRMGLVSGANVIIANTRQNGARNGNAPYGNADIAINAGIIAFNESFVMHYWQNSTNGIFAFPPYADGRGPTKFGGTTGNADYRGYVHLWGGVVQKYRGYMMRNSPGPFNTGDIGMDKDYNYDENLMCSPPPFYPTIENAGDELTLILERFGEGK